jgi:hypothetical protein
MSWVRTWLPLTIIAAGIVVAAAWGFRETGIEGGTLVAAGLSVWLLNGLYRFGVRGERERDDEDRARAFLDEHGYWPDQDPPPPSQPPGAAPQARSGARPGGGDRVHGRAGVSEHARR